MTTIYLNQSPYNITRTNRYPVNSEGIDYGNNYETGKPSSVNYLKYI